MTCSGDGSWQISSSQDPVQTPFCSSNPCYGLSVDDTPALFEQLNCENTNGIAWTAEHYFNDQTYCRLIFCTGGADPDVTNDINLATCIDGVWDNLFTCASLNSLAVSPRSLPGNVLPPLQLKCPEGWEPFKFACYKTFIEALEWRAAEDRCKKVNAHLASIHSTKENLFISNMLTRIDSNAAWIGGYNDAEGGFFWSWTDGSSWNYDNWHIGEPNNYAGVEHCMELRKFGVHNDKNCSDVLSFVCHIML